MKLHASGSRIAAAVLAGAGALLAAGSAHAAEMRSAPGQPFCMVQDDLKEFLLAALQKDMQWMQQLKGCTALKGGLKMAVIDEYDSDSDIGHVDKVRVFVDGSSVVGYTLVIAGLKAK